jgi:ABC-type Fe3+ transport system permease subunit
VLAVSLLAGFLTTISPWFLSIWFGLVSLVSLLLSLVVIGKGIILLVDEDEIEPK